MTALIVSLCLAYLFLGIVCVAIIQHSPWPLDNDNSDTIFLGTMVIVWPVMAIVGLFAGGVCVLGKMVLMMTGRKQ